ncbi:MAG: hypothetical protein AAGF54_11790 [Pseudomonadota bacterium]
MILKKLAFGLGILTLSTYVYMYTTDEALSLHGEEVANGLSCMFIDAEFNIHQYYVSRKNLGYGIHGCPFFTQVR